MSADTRTQAAAVLAYLKQRGAIDPMTALSALGIYRLAARIWDLRQAGEEIETTTTRSPHRTTYKLRRWITPAPTPPRAPAAPGQLPLAL